MNLPSHAGAAALDVEVRPGGRVLVSVLALPGLGYGSSEPIPARCRSCRAAMPPTVNAALTALYQRIATDQSVKLYGSIATCARCARTE